MITYFCVGCSWGCPSHSLVLLSQVGHVGKMLECHISFLRNNRLSQTLRTDLSNYAAMVANIFFVKGEVFRCGELCSTSNFRLDHRQLGPTETVLVQLYQVPIYLLNV